MTIQHNAWLSGTTKSNICKLFLTDDYLLINQFIENAVNGILGKDKHGIFSIDRLLSANLDYMEPKEEKELCEFEKFIGLKRNMVYDDTTEFRYGRIVLLNCDHYEHITMTVIQLFQKFWPELLRKKGFIQRMKLPIVSARKAFNMTCMDEKLILFHDFQDFNNWVQMTGYISGWNIKYHAGPATFNTEEIKAIFDKIDDTATDIIKFDIFEEIVDETKTNKRKRKL